MDYFNRVIDLADFVTKVVDPKDLKWSWGEGLLMYSLSLLDKELNENRYFDFYKEYVDYHYEKGVNINRSNTCAPALITHELYKKTKEEKYNKLTQEVVEYLINEPKLIEDLPNHLGHSGTSKFYPKSIWIDSVVVFGIFSSVYARDVDDSLLIEKAVKHPRHFIKYLQNEETKLLTHTYVQFLNEASPKNLYWGRGNGLMIFGLPIMISAIHDEENIKHLNEISNAILSYQREDYYFNTVINRSDSYRESSVTAFIASGWMQGVREGYLSEKFKAPAINAYKAIVENIAYKGDKVYLQEVSDVTYPIPLLPYRMRLGKYSGYKYVRKENNSSYGLAALFFACLEYKKLIKSS
ncbi:glycoside hydrolase family 88 protein [Mycoplasmatota bacterium zrk1]